jgi:hypothetical protein
MHISPHPLKTIGFAWRCWKCLDHYLRGPNEAKTARIMAQYAPREFSYDDWKHWLKELSIYLVRFVQRASMILHYST